MPIFSPSFVQSLTIPYDAIPGGKAFVNSLQLNVMTPTGPMSLVCDSFVRKCKLSTVPNGLFDSQGRALYHCGDPINNQAEANSGTDTGTIFSIGESALFNAPNNPYTYRHSVVDGGGNFEISYYSLFTSVFGVPDPNGNGRNLMNQPGGNYVPAVPTPNQAARYPSLNANKPITTFLSVDSLAVPSQKFLRTGLAIGALYNPGGTDPPLGNLAWFQVFSTTSLTYASAGIADTGTSQGVEVLGPDGNPYYCGIDCSAIGQLNRSNGIQDVSYGNTVLAPGPFPQANNSFFFDMPSRTFPQSNPISNTQHSYQVFYLFKMFYTDENGNYQTGPVVSPGDIIYFTILNEGLQYSWTVFNANS